MEVQTRNSEWGKESHTVRLKSEVFISFRIGQKSKLLFKKNGNSSTELGKTETCWSHDHVTSSKNCGL